jgi:hypothetical protein
MALEAVRAMVPYNPGWCEEPIPAHNTESMAQGVAASWEAFVLVAPLFASLFCAFFGAFRTRVGLQSPPDQRAAKVTTLARPPAQGGPALLLVGSA